MKDGICPKCQAQVVIPAVKMLDQRDWLKPTPGNLIAYLGGSPEYRPLVKSAPSHFTELRAWICGACGYAELYATDPIGMLLAYKEGNR